MSDPTRRQLLIAGGAVAAGVSVGGAGALLVPRLQHYLGQPLARVSVQRAQSYDVDLTDVISRALQDFPATLAKARGGVVVLKPNLVEFNADRPINTDARVVHAAAEAFRRAGARDVLVAEGPGHRRDTELLVEQTRLHDVLRDLGARFVDLNVDETLPIDLVRNLTGQGRLELPQTVIAADLFVSVAKMKTHHWAGATLTMKNLFGTVPGAVYGWPKNILHWRGIDNSILDLWATIRPGFGIVDGIVGMEGDGPIMGQARAAGVLVMGEQLPAVDATAARIMGLAPHKIPYLARASFLGGTVSARRIEQVGEGIDPVPFALVDRFAHLRA